MSSETITLEGHIVDSLTLSKVLDLVLRNGGEYRIARFHVGSTRKDMSRAEIVVSARDHDSLEQILHIAQQHGAIRPTAEAQTQPAPADGVFPDGFYGTTNLETFVRSESRWIPVANIEMDCGIALTGNHGEVTARCIPMHRARAGDAFVVGDAGVRVVPPAPRDPEDAFGFMGSDVSTERPKELLVESFAQAIQATRENGGRILFVGGPAIVHTGAGRQLEAILRAGWIDVLFAGNALATHDVERALYGTSLGVEIRTGNALRHGHEHHLRAINTIRMAGGLRPAVDAGILTSGIMHACITCGIDYVLAGSIRDDGPLPDVITDSIAAQDAMRARIPGVTVALLVATTLHAVAAGNLLPASVRTLCVDSDPDTVIKLMDRGTQQAFGLVTDCEFFLKELAARLPGVTT